MTNNKLADVNIRKWKMKALMDAHAPESTQQVKLYACALYEACEWIQERRKADVLDPVRYALMWDDGEIFNTYAERNYAVADRDLIREQDEDSAASLSVVPLYAAPQPLTDAERAELQERRKIEGIYHLATLYEIDGVFTKDRCALANARGRNVQGYVEIETANMFYKEDRD
ncbi:TPA: hypothetical protein R5S02_000188 [Salmonella enterica]|nr:hypothetical protein [Salmonella enterica]